MLSRAGGRSTFALFLRAVSRFSSNDTMKLSLGKRYVLLAFLLIVLAFPKLGNAAPVNAGEPKVVMDVSKAKFLVYSPPPEYPAEARRNHWGGSGFFEVQFRRGVAVGVFITMSTGRKVLDNAALATLRQWRSWKDITRVMLVPITFAPTSEKR
jgi:hypothetical protein